MTAYEELWEAQRIIGKHWSAEQAPVLGLARDALDFISTTGQRHRFRAYRQGPPTGGSSEGSSEGLLGQAESFFRRLLKTPQPPDEAELIEVIADALRFIVTTGQQVDLAQYVEHLEAGAPPYAVAAFGSLEDAERWLMDHPDPPDFAHVIIVGEYRSVYYERERNIRKLPNDNAMEYYLAELQSEEPPVAVATFATRHEAEFWLKAQPIPARRIWISIGGEFYLAAYYPHLHHQALFPLAMAKGFQV